MTLNPPRPEWEIYRELPRGWRVADPPDNRPGHLGRSRDERYRSLCARHGARRDYKSGDWNSGGWDLMWRWEQRGEVLVPRPVACQIYEDAYARDYDIHPKRWRKLIKRARDVYDADLTDKESGLDYELQQGVADHLQDIAVRRVLVRNGVWFEGKQDIQIRYPQDEHGRKFSPGKILFQRQDLILRPHPDWWEDVWWDPDSVEDWYQSNKFLVIRE